MLQAGVVGIVFVARRFRNALFVGIQTIQASGKFHASGTLQEASVLVMVILSCCCSRPSVETLPNLTSLTLSVL